MFKKLMSAVAAAALCVSLAACGAVRAAYGPVQTIIWQVESFGFHMVEMEFRQHSVVHARALKDIHENGIHGDLQPMTREVIDTFRAIGSIQKRYGKKMAHRYIISFTKSAQHVADVFELAHLSFAHEEDVPELDVIPLFEQLEDLEGCVDVLDQMLTLPVVQKRLAQTNRRMEVMLGYSDSSKDAGPTTAMLALHSAQERIAKWAEKNDIDLVLMHGRGGAVGRGGGPANKAVLAQPKGSVNCFFKLTEQGEVIFARYGNRTLAQRHVESVAAATLLQSAPSVEKTNTETTQKFWDMAEKLNAASHERYLDLLNTEDHIQYLFGYPDGTFGPENNMTRACQSARVPPSAAWVPSRSTTCVPFRGSSAGARHALTWPLGTAWAPPASSLAIWTSLRLPTRSGRSSAPLSTTSRCRSLRPTSASPRCICTWATAMICPRRSLPRCSSPVSGSLPSSVMSGRCSAVACSAAPSACVTPMSTPCPLPRSAPSARCV